MVAQRGSEGGASSCRVEDIASKGRPWLGNGCSHPDGIGRAMAFRDMGAHRHVFLADGHKKTRPGPGLWYLCCARLAYLARDSGRFSRIVVTTDEVGDDGAGLFGQQLTGCGIPGLQADFPEAVDATGSHVGQIQRGRAGTTDVGTLDEHALEHLQVRLDVVLLLERETGGQDGAGQLFGLADTDAITVQLGTTTTGSSKQLVTDRIVNNGLFSLALHAQGDGDGKVRNAFDQVGRAIQWVNDLLLLDRRCAQRARRYSASDA